MDYREVPIYDCPFPSIEQALTGDPERPPFPKEVWLQQVQAGEFAVRYEDFKTATPPGTDGKRGRDSEKCRIFGDFESARVDCREVVRKHPAVICVVYDQSGAEVERIRNHNQLNKFTFAVVVGFLFWGTLYVVGGMAFLWVLYRLALFAVRLWSPSLEPVHSLSWIGWAVFAAGGLLLSIAAWILRARFVVERRVRRIHSSFTQEEMKRFAPINDLRNTTDPVERQRILELYREYQQRVKAAAPKR